MRAFVVAVLLCVGLIGERVLGAGPSILIVYGGRLHKRVDIVQRDLSTYDFLWCGAGGSTASTKGLGDREYFDIAVFWIPSVWRDPASAERLLPTLRTEDAHQHGRLYQRTKNSQPFVVITTPRFQRRGDELLGVPRSRPKDAAEFSLQCELTERQVQIARAAGISVD